LKILHLNTSNTGGASYAAQRISSSLITLGHEVHFITRADVVFSKERLFLNRALKICQWVILKFSCRFMQFFVRNSYVSTMFFGVVDVDQINESDFDVIHLHWVNSGFISISQISRIKKPIVWTLHDMWITTGLRHVILEDDKLNFIERFLLERNRRILNKLRNLHFVTPSEWLGEKVRRVYKVPVSIIPNQVSVDFDLIKKKNHATNQVLFLHPSKEFHKGFDLLVKALNDVSLTHPIELVTSIRDCGDVNFQVKKFDYIKDEKEVLELISTAKMVIVPSRIDNFPNACLEALKCRVPVVAFRIGGIPEIVYHGKTGYLADPFNVTELAEGIKLILEDKIELDFSVSRMGVSASILYSDLYERIFRL
jgi:glycosyltransferase involved in cell wall biosynthesis